MENEYSIKIAKILQISSKQVDATIVLLEAGATIPFIARYRKEVTGNLDEIAIQQIRDLLTQLKELDKRRATILNSIQEQGKLTKELEEKINKCETMTVLEDIYLPYKPKRRTRAMIAREKGLEPLANTIFEQKGINPQDEALRYVNVEKGVETVEDAIAGARDIIAEIVNEDSVVRGMLRKLFSESGVISSKVVKDKDEEGIKYKDYFQWNELGKGAPSHRILAVRRGEKEKFLIVRIMPPEEEALEILESMFVKGQGEDSQEVKVAIKDSYKRLLSTSLETDIRLELKKRADADAITIFDKNLRQLLMAPPLGQKNVMAIDPGIRTGCKLVCIDSQGKLLHNDTLYLAQSDQKKKDAIKVVKELAEKFNIEVIAIGNGTASRETETFIQSVGLGDSVPIVVVSESGASIYSASDVAREEFPDYDVTVRGAVSIGRRLMDPLAELVKIDPKSIGVGQYQHDVDQKLLKSNLDDVVMSCVNQVGVDVNTASKQLLRYVAGVGAVCAKSIVEYRNTNGAFKSRKQLKKVSGLGQKVFEQSAGFLRINDGVNPLDASAVHPESYGIVDSMIKELGCTISDLMNNDQIRNKIDLNKYVTDTVGLETLTDIKNELAKPGRDPREPFQIFSFQEGIETMEDLHAGMKLPGVVTNITAFGAFVDIGVHQDGLIHISQLADKYVKNPHDEVEVHQKIMVTVLDVDLKRKRISLSARSKANSE